MRIAGRSCARRFAARPAIMYLPDIPQQFFLPFNVTEYF